jgi:hypothetical protein
MGETTLELTSFEPMPRMNQRGRWRLSVPQALVLGVMRAVSMAVRSSSLTA